MYSIDGHNSKYLSIGVLICSFFLLFGCAERDFNDLKVKVGKVKQQPSPPPKELPPYVPDIPYLYTAVKYRSPFQDFAKRSRKGEVDVNNVTESKISDCRRPDAHRLPEALENFPLDSLKMVGTLEQGYKRWGLVLDPDQVIYQVEVNNYLGLNHGKVISITETEIELVEMVEDGQGCYVERSATLAAEELVNG